MLASGGSASGRGAAQQQNVEDVARLLLLAKQDLELARKQLECLSQVASEPYSSVYPENGIVQNATNSAARQMCESIKYIIKRTESKLKCKANLMANRLSGPSNTKATEDVALVPSPTVRSASSADDLSLLQAVREHPAPASGVPIAPHRLSSSLKEVDRGDILRRRSLTTAVNRGKDQQERKSFALAGSSSGAPAALHSLLSGRSSSTFPVGKRLKEQIENSLLLRPTVPAAREILNHRFGVPLPAAFAVGDRLRPIESYGRTSKKLGKRHRSSVAPPPHLLPPLWRKDPHAHPQEISAEDAARGMFELVNRGFVPKCVDLTAALGAQSLRTAPAAIHDYCEQFERQIPATNFSTDLIEFKNEVSQLLPPTMDAYRSRLYARSAPLPTVGMSAPSCGSTALVPLQLAITNGANAFDDESTAGDKTIGQMSLCVPSFTHLGPDELSAETSRTATTSCTAAAPLTTHSAAPTLAESHVIPEQPNSHDPEVDISRRLSLPVLEKSRDYEALMDEFSLHRFIIRKGYVLDTPEFRSFQRKYSPHWSRLLIIISKLETFLHQSNVPLAYIDGQRCAELALLHEAEQIETKHLIYCIVNDEQVLRQLKNCKYRYMGDSGMVKAAVKIQSSYRMHRTRMAYKRYQLLSAHAKKIQVCWRSYKRHQNTRHAILESWTKRLASWQQMMKTEFRDKWDTLSQKKRVLVHLPCLGLTSHQAGSMHRANIKENEQLSRLCDIEDPNVDVLYVSPVPLVEEVEAYYKKIIDLGGCNARFRTKVTCPEWHPAFPSHFTLSQRVYYSCRTIRQIRQFTRGLPAYIVPNAVGNEDLKLAVHLGLPLLGPEPDKYSLFSSKSGSKRIFAAAEVAVPPGVHDVYDADDLYTFLARVIVQFPTVPRWLLKIDNEMGGRGVAYFEPSALKVYNSLMADRDSGIINFNDPHVVAGAEERMKLALKQHIPSKIVLATPHAYENSWYSYAQAFYRSGGVIEASPRSEHIVSSPSVNVFIEPDGTVAVTSTHDQFFSSPYVYAGATFPSKFHHASLHEAATSIAKVCFKEGIIGHIGIDFLVFREESSLVRPSSLRMWAVDLNLRMTDSACSFKLFHFMMRGTYAQFSRHGNTIAQLLSEEKLDPVTTTDKNEKCVGGQYYVTREKLAATSETSLPSATATALSGGRSFAVNDTSSDGNTMRTIRISAGEPAPVTDDTSVSFDKSLDETGLSFSADADTSVRESEYENGRVPVVFDLPTGSSSELHSLLTDRQQEASILPPTTANHSVAVTVRETRAYAVANFVYLPNLSSIPLAAFFHLCRQRNISFDVKQRQGTVFLLMDSLTCGSIGVLCIHQQQAEAVQMLSKALRFVEKQAGAVSMSRSPQLYADESNLVCIQKAVREQMRSEERKSKKKGTVCVRIDRGTSRGRN